MLTSFFFLLAITFTFKVWIPIFFLGTCLFASIVSDINDRRKDGRTMKQIFARAYREFFFKIPVTSAPGMIKLQGYHVEFHEVETSDGFLLGLQRVIPKKPRKAIRGSVILQHGLFQTSLAFLLNNEGSKKALAFQLVNGGYDVWLGNNRGNLYSRAHKSLKSDQVEFWDWCIDDLRLDVEANVEYVLAATGEKTVSFIGHSQGAAQAIMALSCNPILQSKINMFIAMSPGVFVQPFPSKPLRIMSWMYSVSPGFFFVVFGRGNFLPFMEVIRRFVHCRVFTYFAFCMFKYLMEWGDKNWNTYKKPQYFHETPAGSSTRTLAQWMQHSNSGGFRKYDWGVEKNKGIYGKPEPPEYDIKSIHIPIAVIYGGKDTLLDYKRLINELPNCIYYKCWDHHAHLDNLMSKDAHALVYPTVISILNRYRSSSPFPSTSAKSRRTKEGQGKENSREKNSIQNGT